MKKLAEENDLFKQPQQILISSFIITNGTLITAFLFGSWTIVFKNLSTCTINTAKNFKHFSSMLLMLGDLAMRIPYFAW